MSCHNDYETHCWLCDKMIGTFEDKLQCECSLWYHADCIAFTEVGEMFTNQSFVWICCKCRGSNYCQSLHCDFGIPLDENVYCTLDSSNEEMVKHTCDVSSHEQTIHDNGLTVCTMDIRYDKASSNNTTMWRI